MRTMNKPTKRGHYVTIRGTLYPVTGKKQAARAAVILKRHLRRSAPIEYWNGEAWAETGLVLHAA